MNESIHPVENFGAKIAPRQRGRSLNRSYTLAINASKCVIDAGYGDGTEAVASQESAERRGNMLSNRYRRSLRNNLIVDPAVGLFHPITQPRGRLPSKFLADQCIIAIASVNAFWSREVVITF